jgi:hypothetical protein
MSPEIRPQPDDIVIWIDEGRFWVARHNRNRDTQLFDTMEAAHAAAEKRAGPGGAVWLRHTDGRFELLTTPQ